MWRRAGKTPLVLRRDIGAALDALGEAGALEPAAVQTLTDAWRLLRAVRLFLTLLFDATPDADMLPGSAGAVLARAAGSIDIARLDADITAACDGVLAWYDRLIANPAREAIQSKAAQSEPSKEGDLAR
jgi:glutamine synthetase adenylyltransferase